MSENEKPQTQWEQWQDFLREFLRVNFDKILLVTCLLFFWRIHDSEMVKACMVGLAVSINHNRFRWNP